MDPFEQRLKRFKINCPHEIIGTLLNGIHNNYLPQIRIALDRSLFPLFVLGVHSVMETISEYVFGKKGLNGVKFYLDNFVDGPEEDTQFSKIAETLNDWRNIIAHQYLSSLAYKFAYDTIIEEGVKEIEGEIHFNPNVFFDCFMSAFNPAAPHHTKHMIWDYSKMLSEQELLDAKHRLLNGFLNK